MRWGSGEEWALIPVGLVLYKRHFVGDHLHIPRMIMTKGSLPGVLFLSKDSIHRHHPQYLYRMHLMIEYPEEKHE